MIVAAATRHRFFAPVLGGVLVALCGLALWQLPAAEVLVDASYDYLFRFSARPVTNKVALILMDKAAHRELSQTRGNWDRKLHASLLEKLADDGCSLVVFDVIFTEQRGRQSDEALARAMRQQGRVVLAGEVVEPEHRDFAAVKAVPPCEIFLGATTNWGIAKLDHNTGETARRHWPFPGPQAGFSSLPWVAAQLAGAALAEQSAERWLRYYGAEGGWEVFSYHLALSNAPAYFRGKTVFIGSKPETTEPGVPEADKFLTPYTRWTGAAVGGVEILATQFLNLLNGDWLRRLPRWVEALILASTGLLLGILLGRIRPWKACLVAAGAAFAVVLGAVLWSYYTNYWFPWLIVAGGQVPCALAWGLASPLLRPARGKAAVSQAELGDYERFDPPFGEGAFGKVWVVKNAVGQWQALKEVYREKFGGDTRKFEMEFNGIQKYKPISHKHPGLLRIEFVSKERAAGYFYYVMELGDPVGSGWERDPPSYRPRDLSAVCELTEGKRVPVWDCVAIGVKLAEALEFLHQEGLTHRDIKPRNIIFVGGQPKLADAGTVTTLRPPDLITTMVGTLGYMPPLPERPGTRQADIYSLGVVLYVISTGRHPIHDFPALSTSLLESVQFRRFNEVIRKACQPDLALRYPSAAAMHADLLAAQEELEREPTKRSV